MAICAARRSQGTYSTSICHVHFMILLDNKGSSGQSDPVRIEVGEREYTYEVTEGDTVDSIAEVLGTTPEILQELNPGIGTASSPGTSMGVPGFSADHEGEDDTPLVDPPSAPPPPSGEETPAEPISTAWWTFLPLPDNFACLFDPTLCSSSPAGEEPASPPIDVSAELNDSCQVLVSWLDRADNELGFRVYRSSMGSGARPEVVALLRAVPGSGERISFVDETSPNGRFFYAVSAYNSSGEFWSPSSEWVTAACHLETIENVSLSVEALEMTVRDPYERLYCYVSLAASPYERVPGGSSFIEFESGLWNIAEHFSGENKRSIYIHREGPLDIVAECMGWQGGALINLGRFSRSHPPEEWDGRNLTAGPPDGGFNVTYVINPTSLETGSFAEIIDPSIRPPYDVHVTESSYRCGAGTTFCPYTDEPGIGWSNFMPADTSEPLYFKLYGRRADEDTPLHYYTADEPRHHTRLSVYPDGTAVFRYAAPQAAIARLDCDVSIFYSVNSVVGHDPTTGEEIVSPRSEELEVPPSCPQLEITLIALHVFSAPDGDPGTDFCFSDCGASIEGYGWLQVGGHNVIWNDHCDPGFGTGCLTSGPSYTDLPQGSIVFWENEFLSTGSGRGTGQNVFRIPIEEGQDLTMTLLQKG